MNSFFTFSSPHLLFLPQLTLLSPPLSPPFPPLSLFSVSFLLVSSLHTLPNLTLAVFSIVFSFVTHSTPYPPNPLFCMCSCSLPFIAFIISFSHILFLSPPIPHLQLVPPPPLHLSTIFPSDVHEILLCVYSRMYTACNA